jgi:hypothetical protein
LFRKNTRPTAPKKRQMAQNTIDIYQLHFIAYVKGFPYQSIYFCQRK